MGSLGASLSDPSPVGNLVTLSVYAGAALCDSAIGVLAILMR